MSEVTTETAVKTYEIINPSDAYTLQAKDPMVAALACMVLGEGAYGLEDEKGEEVCPFFIFGGDPDAWLRENFGQGLEQALKSHAAEIAEVLDSVLIGGFDDRREYESAVALMTPEGAAAYRAIRADIKRTSMNNIGAMAAKLATYFKAQAK
jgi:hypothetical protein